MISIIIVNWNGKKWLNDCLETLHSQDYQNFEIIFVDNNSEDDSVEFVREKFKKVIIIQNKENLGFGKANNIGVGKSHGDILFFLNNDTQCFQDTLENLIKCRNKSKINILCPAILNQEGECLEKGLFSSGMDFLGTPIGPNKKMFYVEGCSMMISKKDFLRLGGFDERYFMYSEDIDLCWRAHLQGMKLGICDNSKLIHFGGGSSEKTRYDKKAKHVVPVFRRYEVEKNNLRNLLKNYRFFNLLWTVPLFVVQNFFEALLYLVSGNSRMVKVIWKAFYWNLVNVKDTLEERKKVQKTREVGDLKIFSKMNFSPSKIKIFLKMGMPKFK